MKKIQVFDPPMCCTSGVCGTNVDTKLVTFASDVEWFKKQGIDIVRYGLAFEPQEFVKNEIVKKSLQDEGNDCLPLTLVDNEVVFKGGYPDRKKLAQLCGIEWKAEYATQEVVTAEELASSSICGPDCDCHQSDVSDKTKKIIFVVVLLIIAGILAIKSTCKANAVEAKHNMVVNSTSAQLGEYIDSIDELKTSQDVSFVFIPAKNNLFIRNTAKTAAVSAQAILMNKNIKVNLYTLKITSPEYSSLAKQTTPPAILAIKGQGQSFVSGEINQTRLLQAYMAALKAAECSSGCPCHKK